MRHKILKKYNIPIYCSTKYYPKNIINVENLTEEEQIDLVKEDIFNLKLFTNPSVRLQYEILNDLDFAIKHLYLISDLKLLEKVCKRICISKIIKD